MPQQALTNAGINFNWDAGEDGWKAGVDNNWVVIDTLMQGRVLAVNQNTPPGSPASGDAYTLGAAPTGAWSTHAGKVAVYINTAWVFVIPRSGWRVHRTGSPARVFQYSGSTWLPVRKLDQVSGQLATSYTLGMEDASSHIRNANASAQTITIPPNSTTAFEIGTEISLSQAGAGQVTISPGAGVTLQSADSKYKTRGLYSSVLLRKVDTDTWELSGDTGT